MFKVVCSESEHSCEESGKVGMQQWIYLSFILAQMRCKCDAKSTEQTEPIKQSGQTVESDSEQHARRKHRVQKKQTGAKKPHSM